VVRGSPAHSQDPTPSSMCWGLGCERGKRWLVGTVRKEERGAGGLDQAKEDKSMDEGIERIRVKHRVGLLPKSKVRGGTKYGKRFIFTERDQKALKWIAEQGVATVEQLWWVAWKDEESKSSKYADERLRVMARGSYLKRERVFGSGATNYIVTQKGRDLVDEAYPDRKAFLPPVPKRVNDGQYRHTMALNWCRVFLEKDDQVTHWVSDRAIQSWLKRRKSEGSLEDWIREIERISPDACFKYQGERWLFEYEATQKNKAKYQKKAEAISWSDHRVIFVTATSGLKAILAKYFKRGCIIFTLDELKQGKVTAFLKTRWEKQEREQREREREYEQKKKEAQAQIPGLTFELERLVIARAHLGNEIQEAERDRQNALSRLSQFENGFIKLPGQKESLGEKVHISNRRISELRTKECELSKQITHAENEIKDLGQF
jgi:hypothetical protein